MKMKLMLRKTICIIILLLSALPTFIPLPVYALATTLTVIGEGGRTDGTYVGAGDFTDVQVDDGDTSYLGKVGYTTHTYDVSAMPVALTISSVKVYAKFKTDNGNIKPVVGIAGTIYEAPSWLADASATYKYVSYSWATNPATGLAWTKAGIDSTEFGIVFDPVFAGSYIRITYLYVEVTYTAPTAPLVTSTATTSIAATSATLNGNISSDGGSAITDYGFIWDTSSHANPGNVAHDGATGYATNWGGGAIAVGAITHATGATLTHGTTYYYRAGAGNAIGWTWGDEITFNTINHSAITINPVTNIATTTATLNSQLTTDGGEACSVEFVYAAGTFANYAAVAAAGGHVHSAAAGTWVTGGLPTVNIIGLTAATTYTVSVSSINSVDVAYGTIVSGVVTFTTESGVYIPTNFTAIPSSTTMSLSWTKGVGAAQTAVRYSPGTYPASITDGTLAYLNTGNSYQLTGLTAGTTYYFSAWGYTAGLYSGTGPDYTNGKITTMSTTLAYNAPSTTPTPNSITVAPPNSQWSQTPDATKARNIPLIGGLITANANAYNQPENMMWYLVWMLCSTCIGIIVFNKSNNNLTLALFVTCFATGAGMVIGLTMMWIIALMLFIGAGFSMFGGRY